MFVYAKKNKNWFAVMIVSAITTTHVRKNLVLAFQKNQ